MAERRRKFDGGVKDAAFEAALKAAAKRAKRALEAQLAASAARRETARETARGRPAAEVLAPLVEAAATVRTGCATIAGLDKTAFEGGATRTAQAARFDLVPPAAVRALARRLTLGAARHGERNWERGGEAFRVATVSHLMAHLLRYMDAPNPEDADALICNAAFLCHFEAGKGEGGA